MSVVIYQLNWLCTFWLLDGPCGRNLVSFDLVSHNCNCWQFLIYLKMCIYVEFNSCITRPIEQNCGAGGGHSTCCQLSPVTIAMLTCFGSKWHGAGGGHSTCCQLSPVTIAMLTCFGSKWHGAGGGHSTCCQLSPVTIAMLTCFGSKWHGWQQERGLGHLLRAPAVSVWRLCLKDSAAAICLGWSVTGKAWL